MSWSLDKFPISVETTAHAMAFAFALLALQRDVQDALRVEVLPVLPELHGPMEDVGHTARSLTLTFPVLMVISGLQTIFPSTGTSSTTNLALLLSFIRTPRKIL